MITLKNSRNRTLLNISKTACLLLLMVLCLAIFMPNISSHQFPDNIYIESNVSVFTGKDPMEINVISKFLSAFEEELEVVVGQNTSAIITFKFQGLNFSISGVNVSSEAFKHVKYIYLVFTSFSKDYDMYWPKPIWEYPKGVTLVLCFDKTTFENALDYAYSIYRDFSQAFGLGEMSLINFVSLNGDYAFMFNKFLNSSVSAYYAWQILASVLPGDGLATLIDIDLMVNSLFYGFSIGYIKYNGKLTGSVFVSWLNPSAVFLEGNEYVVSVNYIVNHTGFIEPSKYSTYSYIKIRFPYIVNVTDFFVEPLGGKHFSRTYIFDLLPLDSVPDIGLKYDFNILPEDIPLISAFVEVKHGTQGRMFGPDFHVNITIHLKSLGTSDAYNVTVMFPYSTLKDVFDEIDFCDFTKSDEKLIVHRNVLKRGESDKFTFVVGGPHEGKKHFMVGELSEGAVITYEDKVGRKYVVYANSFGFDIPIPLSYLIDEFKLHPTITIDISPSQAFLNETQVVKVTVERSDILISSATLSLYYVWINPITFDLKVKELITSRSLGSRNVIEISLEKTRKIGYHLIYGVLTYEMDGETYTIYSNVVPFVVFPEKVEAEYPYPLPVLEVSKKVESGLKVGEHAWINVTVSNVGDENTTITIYETVPDAFKIIGVNVSRGTVREEEIEIGGNQYTVIIVDDVDLGVEDTFHLRIFVKVVHASVVEIPPTSCIATTSYEDFEVMYPSASEILQANSIATYSQAHSIIISVVKLLTYNKTFLLYLIIFDAVLLLFIIIKIRKEKRELSISFSL